MTLYYSLCFLLLAAEIALSAVILGPWPHSLRKKIFTFLNENPFVAKVQYGLKITFIFVALLFVDAVQRLVRVSQEANANRDAPGGATDLRTETAVHSRKFYAQRNLYLTGGTLGLALVLSRAFSFVLELVTVNDQLAALRTSSAKSSRVEGGVEGLKLRVTELEKEVEKKDRDLETLKSQAATQAREFDRQAGVVGAGKGADKKLD